MAVGSRFMHFRNERARELGLMADLLDKYLSGEVSTYPIHNAIAHLRDNTTIPQLKNQQANDNIWGYDIEDFEIPIETIKHVKPNDITKGSASLTLKIRADINKWNSFEDPLIELGFNVVIKGIGTKVYHFGFHIDKHIAGDAAEPHPIYHLQYNLNPTKLDEPDLGALFYIDTPRIMHKPLDFILGITFLTCNFYPTAFEVLCNDNVFNKLNKQYQESIWKPYFHTLANHWKPFEQKSIVWTPANSICPIFL